ncbi:unnamed protein product [Didymodactylos carnosus]|uniref:Uncharacterized protein n=2 Tax=Didymodactylos carnosus TaxID=1234261 RepID=A0A8S2EAP7_9BILA|nr:unnamed protein product [Didymodactylos carnosus]CAF3984297.1 unnamed protein product [Didymodactylos carnosus]
MQDANRVFLRKTIVFYEFHSQLAKSKGGVLIGSDLNRVQFNSMAAKQEEIIHQNDLLSNKLSDFDLYGGEIVDENQTKQNDYRFTD